MDTSQYLGVFLDEAKEHIQTYWDMVIVVGHIETDQLMALAILILPEREHQTTELLLGVTHLIVLPPSRANRKGDKPFGKSPKICNFAFATTQISNLWAKVQISPDSRY